MPTTTYMVLTLPSVEVTLGPLWASMLNAAIEEIDEHDHTTGSGKQVPAAGLNINDDLSFASHNVSALKSARFTSQSAPLGGVSDLSCLYVSSGNLYYNNSSGTQIQLTTGGSINVAGISANNFARLAVSTDITIGAADTYVHYDVSTAGVRTLTLPAAAGVTPGRFYIFKDVTGQAATNILTIVRAGSDTFDGAATSVTVNNNYGAVMVVSDGTSAWRVERFSDPGYLNGATVPAGSGLTTGNVLKASGAGALSYGAVDLGGGAGHITGLLPWANIVSPVPLAHLTDATGAAKGIVQLAQDIGGTAAAPTVVALTGSGGKIQLRSGCDAIEFAGATNPTIQSVASAAAPTVTYLVGQAAGAGFGGNHNGGVAVVKGGAPHGTGAPGASALAVSTGDILVGALAFSASRRVAALAATNPVTTDVPAGDLVTYFGDAATAPSSTLGSQTPVGGFVLYSSGGYPAFKTGTTGTTIRFENAAAPASIGGAGVTVGNTCTKVLSVNVDGTNYFIPLHS